MASPSYTTDVVVIRKTKLSESDLILDMIAPNASLIKAVAKSARKPGNTFSNRLDLFNVAHITCAKCKTLDIIRECSLIDSHANLRTNMILQASAATIAELVWRLTWDGSVNEHLFDFLVKTYNVLDQTYNADNIILATALLKLLALEGLRPVVEKCTKCECVVSDRSLRFSYLDGGVICPNCSISENVKFDIVNSVELTEMNYMLRSTYEEVLQNKKHFCTSSKVLQLLERWIHFHVGYSLKALEMYNSIRHSVS